MPSRVLRDTYDTSDTVAALPPGPQDRLPRYFLVADDFGCFRLDLVALKGRHFCKRPDITPEVIAADLAEYEKLGLVVFWGDASKVYGFFRGWYDNQNKPRGHSKRKTPAPPANLTKSNHFAISAIRDKKEQECPSMSQSQSMSIEKQNPPADKPPGGEERKRTDKPPDPRRRPLIDAWMAAYEKHKGNPYPFSDDGSKGAANGKHVNKALAKAAGMKLDLPAILARVDWFFASKWHREDGASLAVFASHFERLGPQATGPPGNFATPPAPKPPSHLPYKPDDEEIVA